MTHLLLPGFLACASVFECDQAFGEGFVFEEGKFTLWEAAGKERAALADQHGNDSNIKLVDYVVFEEVASEFAPPISQMPFPGRLRSCSTKLFGDSLTKVTPSRSPGG